MVPRTRSDMIIRLMATVFGLTTAGNVHQGIDTVTSVRVYVLSCEDAARESAGKKKPQNIPLRKT